MWSSTRLGCPPQPAPRRIPWWLPGVGMSLIPLDSFPLDSFPPLWCGQGWSCQHVAAAGSPSSDVISGPASTCSVPRAVSLGRACAPDPGLRPLLLIQNQECPFFPWGIECPRASPWWCPPVSPLSQQGPTAGCRAGAALARGEQLMHKAGQTQTFPGNEENLEQARQARAARLAQPQAPA